jgi:hypothetical protein
MFLKYVSVEFLNKINRYCIEGITFNINLIPNSSNNIAFSAYLGDPDFKKNVYTLRYV